MITLADAGGALLPAGAAEPNAGAGGSAFAPDDALADAPGSAASTGRWERARPRPMSTTAVTTTVPNTPGPASRRRKKPAAIIKRRLSWHWQNQP